MLTGRKIAECIHLAALGIWLGALLMGGGTAAYIFPAMKNELQPTLPAYSAFPEPHGVIAGGYVGEFVFLVLDITGFLALFVAIISLVAAGVYRMSLRRISTMVRAGFLGMAMIAVAYQILAVAPQMREHLLAFREAARLGNVELAMQSREAFAAMHPLSTRVLGMTALCVLGAFITGVWSACTGSSTKPLPDAPMLEDPALLTTPL